MINNLITKTKRKMKKLFFLLTIVGLISFASCKQKEAKVEASADTTSVQVDSIVDTATVVK